MGHHQRVWRTASKWGSREKRCKQRERQKEGDATGRREARERSGKESTARNNCRRGWIRGRVGAWWGERCRQSSRMAAHALNGVVLKHAHAGSGAGRQAGRAAPLELRSRGQHQALPARGARRSHPGLGPPGLRPQTRAASGDVGSGAGAGRKAAACQAGSDRGELGADGVHDCARRLLDQHRRVGVPAGDALNFLAVVRHLGLRKLEAVRCRGQAASAGWR